MSLRALSTIEPEHFLSRALKKPWNKATILLMVTALIYHSAILQLYRSWFDNPYYDHGFLIPLISFYLLWRNRKKLKDIEIASSSYGLVVSFFGIFLFLINEYFSIDLFLSSSSMIIFLMGGVLFTFGKEYLRALLLPILFLLSMVPIPYPLINFLIGHLQLASAKIGELILRVIGVPVYREGVYLNLTLITVEVDGSCSAVRSLIALSSLSVVVAYLMAHSLKKRAIIVASSLPLAVLANGFRIVFLIFLFFWQGEPALNGVFHPISGKVFFLAALSVLVLEASVLKRFGGLGTGASPAS